MSAPAQAARASHVLLCGFSTRAAAASATRAGFAVTALDAFGDLDQAAGVTALSMPRDFGKTFTAAAAARSSAALDGDAVVYLSPFENHPRAVEALARRRPLWGNPPAVLRRARDPLEVSRVLRAHRLPSLRAGISDPMVASPEPPSLEPRPPQEPGLDSWLVKPLRSGGGRGIRRWQPGVSVPSGWYTQQFVDGVPGSMVFAAAGGRAVPLCMSRQLVGDPAFGSAPAGRNAAPREFRYCGNILSGADAGSGGPLWTAAASIAGALAEDLGLVGVNTIDFVAVDRVPFVTEINPRWSGSMELLDRHAHVPVFDVHARACADGVLPSGALAADTPRAAAGKAIVYARAAVTAGDTHGWLSTGSIGDVPHPGERIAAGRPICTVFASGETVEDCHEALRRRADWVYAEIGG